MSGQKKILMKDLIELFQSVGFQNVRSYIQSGNVVFESDESSGLDGKISEVIEEKYGFYVPVLVLSTFQLETIINNCPFSEEKKEKSYFALLFSSPSPTEIKILDEISMPNEEFRITPNCVYLHYALGAGKAKMGNNFFEKKLKVTATSRNYRTMKKILEMAIS